MRPCYIDERSKRPMNTTKTVIIDNGGGRIKYGLATDESPRSAPNCIAQVRKTMTSYTADQLDADLNGSLLHYTRPHDHGYLTKMETQRQIWARLFDNIMHVTPNESTLIMTEPMFNFDSIQNDINEVIFEEYGFAYHMRRPACWFSAYEYASNPPADAVHADCCTVIHSGFSFTHIVPFINLKCQKHAVNIIQHSYLYAFLAQSINAYTYTYMLYVV